MAKKYLTNYVGLQIYDAIIGINTIAKQIISKLGESSEGGGESGGGDEPTDPLTYTPIVLKSGGIFYRGSDNKYYATNNGSHLFVGEGEYELENGDILTISSNGTGTITTPTTPEIPDDTLGYIELEYLTIPNGTWNQSNYFDTGIETYCKSIKLTMIKYKPGSISDFCLMGVGSDASTFFGIQDGKININGNRSAEIIEANVLYNNIVFDVKHNNTATFSIDGNVLHSVSDNWNGQQGTIKSKAFSGARGMVGDFYEMIWEQNNNGTVISDMIPVVRKSDNLVCFYDKIREIYILPEEGTWVAGPEKNNNSEIPAKKMTTWEEDFSSFSESDVYNDENGWYELALVDGRLRTILREPDATQKFATFFINLPSPLNISEGQYLSIDINSIDSAIGTSVGSAAWNNGNCFNMRLVDGSGGTSSWIPICANGIGSSGGIMPAGTSLDKENISTYIGSVDTEDIVKLEISLIGWLDYATVSYKNRNKGVYIDNIRLSRNTTETAEEGSASGGTSGGETTPSGPSKKLTTWSEDFSNGVSMVENDENGWYELSASSGRLSAILREPDTTAKLACFIINTPSPLDLSDGAYLQIDIQGISGGTATVSSSWNDYSCFAMRLRDSSGAYTGWVEIDADGIGKSSAGISNSNKVTMTSRTNIASYLGTSADLSNIVAAEITLVGWPSTTISYKARDKGVYIDNLIISRSATETPEEGAASSGGGSQGGGSSDITYRRVSASYSNLSTTNFNDIADVYQSVKSGDRLMIIVRHSERDSATGKDAGLNSNGLSILQNTAAPKVVGAPFADSSTDKYYSTNVKRTVETAYFIGKARGASGCTSSSLLGSNWENETAVDHSGDTSSSISWVKATPGPHTYFNDHFTGGTNWVTAQNYYKNSKTTCTNDCEAAINWLAKDSEGHPFVMLGSHDLCMVPFVCWATDNGNFFSTWNNDYDSNPSGWIMYMAGVAVIVHSDGGWEVYPIKMLDKGKFD